MVESDCDPITIEKVLENVETAGALWHIYNSRDADKIRDLLNKVCLPFVMTKVLIWGVS